MNHIITGTKPSTCYVRRRTDSHGEHNELDIHTRSYHERTVVIGRVFTPNAFVFRDQKSCGNVTIDVERSINPSDRILD